jgi:hypothetical protein
MIEAATKTCKMCDQPVRSKRSVYCSVACFHRYESEYTTRRRATFSPERKRAGTLVYEAVQRGDLKPSPCEVCGNTSKPTPTTTTTPNRSKFVGSAGVATSDTTQSTGRARTPNTLLSIHGAEYATQQHQANLRDQAD